MFYAVVPLVVALTGAWVVLLLIRSGPTRHEVAAGARRSWIAGLTLLAVGACFFVVGALDVPGADLGEDLEFSAVVDHLGGGVAATGYALAFALVAFLLLGLFDPGRSGRLLVRAGLAATPLMAVPTTLTALFDRDEWKDSSIGPFMGCVFFVTLPACLVGLLLGRAGHECAPAAHGHDRLLGQH